MGDQLPATPPPQAPAQTQVLVRQTDGMAIAALVVGLVSIFGVALDGIPAIVLGAIAVFLGLRSRRRIKRSEGVLTGGGLATAGWMTGLVGIVLGAFVAVVVIGLFLAMQNSSSKGGP